MNKRTGNNKSLLYRVAAIFMIVMMLLAAMPVTPAFAADTGLLVPSANTNVGWSNPQNAYASDGNRAVADDGDDIVQYSNFNIPVIPPGATINGIEVLVEGYQEGGGTPRQANISLSWNNGTTYTTGSGTGIKTTNMPGNTAAAEAVRTFGGIADTWNRTWTPSDFTNTNFRLRLDTNPGSGGRDLFIDRVQVRVTYSLPSAPTITSANAATFTVGVANSFTVTATSAPAPTFAVTTGTLPSGVTLNATTGVLSGTPATGTVNFYPITITASNGTLPNATQNFTLTVQKATTTTTISSDTPDPSLTAQNVVVNYTVASAGNAIARTGNVTVSDGVNNCVGTAAAGTCTLALTTVGARTLTATYAGDTNFNGSASAGTAHNVTSSFVLTASAGAGGTITPNSAVSVAGGANQTFTSAPNTTFILSDVLVDGVSVGRANSYTFNAVAVNHTIAASFDGNWLAPTASTLVGGAVLTPNEAFSSNNIYASFDSATDSVNYTTFGIPAIPPGATINGIQVAIEGYNGQVAGRNLQVQISWNGGTTFTTITPARTTTMTITDGTVILGGVADTWGRTWTNTEFTNPNFIIRATSTGGGTPPVNIDQLQVKVNYSVPPVITSVAPSNSTAGVAYSHTYTATGATPITFLVTSGALPPGLTLTSAGVLSGTPTTSGLYTGTVTAANGILPNSAQNFSINIAAISPTITSATPSGGILNTAYTHTYTATGTAPITFSVTSGSLPNGLTLSTAGLLSGTPASIGTYTGIVTASNGTLPDATQNFSITVNEASAITSPNSASFTLGVGGNFVVTATGSPTPTLSMTGSLPAGVTFVAGTGILSGTPAAGTAGNYPLIFTAANGVGANAAQNFTLTVTEGPSFTSAATTTFSLGLPGTFTVTTVGNPVAAISVTGSLPAGVSFVDNGNGTGTLSGTPTVVGSSPLTFTATNGILPNAIQSFTLKIKNGPMVNTNGINSIPDTGNGSISNNESIIDTLGVDTLTVRFDQDVYDDPTDTTDYAKDVTNPANYMLVMGNSTGVFQTVSCSGGVVAPDVSISVDSVSYSNGGGSGPFVATLGVNGGNPLNVVGFYRLYVCGTTSIADAANIALELAGDGVNPGTDFILSFRIATVAAAGGGGGAGGGNNAAPTTAVATTAALIPVTGFAPDRITTIPAQPADKAYKSMGEIRIEIPTLGINYPIVGAMLDKNSWDLTWLKNSVAYLEGSAYPTLPGNSVLTAHVVDANNNLGPFSDIKGMQSGQNIYIHSNGQIYVYQVQENRRIAPSNTSAAFQHEEYNSWITLVTCEDYNAKTGLYKYRRMVRAVLVSVISEK